MCQCWPTNVSLISSVSLSSTSRHVARWCLSVNITFTTNEWSPALIRTVLPSFGQFTVFPADLWTEEPQRITWWEIFDFVLLILLAQCWGGDSRSCCRLAPSSLSQPVSLSLSLCSVSYCLFSLRTDLKGKSQSARCWYLRTQQGLRDHLLICCMCVISIYMIYIIVHIFVSDLTHGAVQQQKKTAVDQSILIWADMDFTHCTLTKTNMFFNTRPKPIHSYFMYESKCRLSSQRHLICLQRETLDVLEEWGI